MKSSLPLFYYHSGTPNNKLSSIPPEFTPDSPYQSASFPDLTHYQSDTMYNTQQQQDGSDFPLTAIKQYVSQKITSGQRSRPKQEPVIPKGGSLQLLVKEPLTPVDGMTCFLCMYCSNVYQCVILQIAFNYIYYV